MLNMLISGKCLNWEVNKQMNYIEIILILLFKMLYYFQLHIWMNHLNIIHNKKFNQWLLMIIHK
jgi:hypothetical protein